MEQQPAPIKRSAELTPLSHDHHEALLFVFRLRQGLKNGTDIKVLANFVQWFWEKHMQEHFREEEQILAPHLPANNPLLQQMMDEHQEIEALIHINESIRDSSLLTRFADTLHDHVRFEERTLFPYAEQHIPAQSLELIRQELVKTERSCEKYFPEFWVKK
jgi:hemerythrin-like domain-containing protein